MIGIVVATHGRLAQALVSTAEEIVGPLPQVTTCAVQPGSSPSEIRGLIAHAVDDVESPEGVLVLADLLGGTPCNESLSLCKDHHVEVLTGVNLPMLLKANSMRDSATSLTQLALELAAYAQKNITCASTLFRSAAEGTGSR
ncbi:MAG: PTS sugar transporter subunit IIA [Myxococcaceae bacterium]|nr:PTS sugar transporter subunit IIA [Myxococcaceae bacterium]